MTTAQSAGLNAVAVQKYLSEVAKTHRMGHATAEASHYPVMNALLTSLGQVCRPRMSALNAPKAIDGNFPDVALYEDSSNVLVMPVEVKGADQDLSSLAVSTQARSYAVSFGGGRVLSTNLRGFALSELDASTGKLVERDRVELVDSAARFTEKHPQPAPGSAERARLGRRLGCQTLQSVRQRWPRVGSASTAAAMRELRCSGTPEPARGGETCPRRSGTSRSVATRPCRSTSATGSVSR